jgi:hypothetical protein
MRLALLDLYQAFSEGPCTAYRLNFIYLDQHVLSCFNPFTDQLEIFFAVRGLSIF